MGLSSRLKKIPELVLIVDVALDPYTVHSTWNIGQKRLRNNDKTVEVLKKQALVLADAGADVIAPSDIMDGRIGAIKKS